MSDKKGNNDVSIAVGLDLGTWNARVAIFNTGDDDGGNNGNNSNSNSNNANAASNGNTDGNKSGNTQVGPELIHNHDGARATRAAVTIIPKEDREDAGNVNDPDYYPPPPRQVPPKSVVDLMRSHIGEDGSNDETVHEEMKEIREFLKNVVLQLACNAAHVPFAQLGVVTSLPALPLQSAAGQDDDHNSDETTHAYIQQLQAILQKNFIGCLLEPVAVCLAYSYIQKPKDCQNVLVVDLGASGIKVSHLEQRSLAASHSASREKEEASSLWSLKYHTVNSGVSGPLLVDCLGKHVAQQFETKCRFPRGEVWTSKKARKKLPRSGESALTTLLQRSATTTTIHIDGLYEGMDCQVSVSKPRWEMLSSSLANQVKSTIQKAMQHIVGSANDSDKCTKIDQIWLSGPLHAWMQPLVTSACPKDTKVVGLSSTLDPSEAVSLGCAIHAQAMMDNSIDAVASDAPKKNQSGVNFSKTIPLSPVEIQISQVGPDADDDNTNLAKYSRLIDVGTPLPAMATYQPTATTAASDNENGEQQPEESKEGSASSTSSTATQSPTELSVWQTAPTKKKLATLDIAACIDSNETSLVPSICRKRGN